MKVDNSRVGLIFYGVVFELNLLPQMHFESSLTVVRILFQMIKACTTNVFVVIV